MHPAGLAVGPDQRTYAELDRYLAEGPPGAAPALAMKIERLARASDHKRELPPMPDFE